MGYQEKSPETTKNQSFSLKTIIFNPSFLFSATMTALPLKWGSKVSISKGFSPALRNSLPHSLKKTSVFRKLGGNRMDLMAVEFA
jgi:hypothetical protein